MEKLTLSDGQEIEISPGAGISRIETSVESYSELETLATKLKKENLKSVAFSDRTMSHGVYKNMTLQEPHFKVTDAGDKIQVIFGLRELTEDELRAPQMEQAIAYLTDEQAVTVKGLYDEYDPNGVSCKTGDRKTYNDILYKCLQDHTSQPGWEPGVAPSLWVALESGSEAGTLEDPIPVPDTVTTSGMEYEYGKYYKEGDTVYLCQRGGVEDPEFMYGQKETLYFAPSALVGQYFVVAGE
jgi:hypothetical protein